MTAAQTCLLSPTAAPATEAGVEYRCQVCGRLYRSQASPDRISLACRGTPEQWAARRREIATAIVVEAVPDARRGRALDQLGRCLACSAFLGATCRLCGCGASWLKLIQRERCEAR